MQTTMISLRAAAADAVCDRDHTEPRSYDETDAVSRTACVLTAPAAGAETDACKPTRNHYNLQRRLCTRTTGR